MTDVLARSRTNWWSIGLWAAQILLALAYGAAGGMKTFMPIADISAQMAWAAASPDWLIRFIGVAELAGAVGLILPSATRILAWLTPLAALGLSVIQVLAISLHAVRGETTMTLPANIVFLALAMFVVWGRWQKAPIASR